MLNAVLRNSERSFRPQGRRFSEYANAISRHHPLREVTKGSIARSEIRRIAWLLLSICGKKRRSVQRPTGRCYREHVSVPFNAEIRVKTSALVLMVTPSVVHRRSWKRTFRARKSRDTRRNFSRISVPSSKAGWSARPNNLNGGKSAKAIGTSRRRMGPS